MEQIEGNLETKKFFELFKEEYEKALIKLGLKDWRIYYELKELEDNFALSHTNARARTVRVQLATKFHIICPPTKEFITRIAKHEALHLLMADLLSHANNRFTTQDILDIEEEKIVRTLENLI